MYEIDDLVIYGSEGVYKVTEIGSPDIPAIGKDRVYYTLVSVYGSGKTYAPVDGTVFMRPVITSEEAQQLIAEIPDIETALCDKDSPRELSDYYKTYVQSHDCKDLIQLMKTVYAKRKEAVAKGKKLGQIDERYMKRAEELLYEEFAAALQIEKDEVENYITEKINKAQEAKYAS